MKIAFVSTEKLPVPAVLGGAVQIYIDGILPYLSKSHEITVFSGACAGLRSEEIRGSVRFVRIAAKPGRYIDIVKSRLDSSYDLVHIFNRPLWLLSVSSSHPGLSCSLSLHNDMFSADRMTKCEVSECVKKARFITAISKYAADMAIEACPAAKDKISIIYSGVDSNVYKPVSDDCRSSDAKDELKKVIGLQNHKVVLFVGRITPDKGAHVLLRAMEELMSGADGIDGGSGGMYGVSGADGISRMNSIDSVKGTALVIAGSKQFGSSSEDEYSIYLKKLSKKLKGPVAFTGFLPPDKLVSYYRMADIFVCPSQWNEPLARVIYEAMSSGLPVITTDRGGNAEVVSNHVNGIVVREHRDHRALARAISMFLNDPAMAQEMGRAGRALVKRSHGWDRVAADIENAINIHLKRTK